MVGLVDILVIIAIIGLIAYALAAAVSHHHHSGGVLGGSAVAA